MTARDAPRQPPPDDCPLERYLNVVSGVWVSKIIWFLRVGPRRFGDLRRDLGKISPKVLTAKLRALEEEELVVRRVIATSPPQVEYSLSARGRAFDPVFEAMERVSAELKRIDEARA